MGVPWKDLARTSCVRRNGAVSSAGAPDRPSDQPPDEEVEARIRASGLVRGRFAEASPDARRVLEHNEPGHPYLTGDWPDYPWTIRKLNPFAGERSAIDNDARRRKN